jgi:hypothetical protein
MPSCWRTADPTRTATPTPHQGPVDSSDASPFRASLSDPGSAPDLDRKKLCPAAVPTAVGTARRSASTQLTEWNLNGLADGCILVIGELITSSIKATGTLAAPSASAGPLGRTPATVILRLRLTPPTPKSTGSPVSAS